MRSFVASLLLAALSFPLIAPGLLAPDAESSLPPCCRRDGHHHCAMMAMRERAHTPSGPGILTARCPLYPQSAAAPAPSPRAVIKADRGNLCALATYPVARARTQILLRIPFGRTGQKRGPPILA